MKCRLDPIQIHHNTQLKSHSHSIKFNLASHQKKTLSPIKMPFRSNFKYIIQSHSNTVQLPLKSHKHPIKKSHGVPLKGHLDPIEIFHKTQLKSHSHSIKFYLASHQKIPLSPIKMPFRSHSNPSPARFRGGLSMCASARGLAELMASEADAPMHVMGAEKSRCQWSVDVNVGSRIVFN